jgi:hypothetical protein
MIVILTCGNPQNLSYLFTNIEVGGVASESDGVMRALVANLPLAVKTRLRKALNKTFNGQTTKVVQQPLFNVCC